MYVKKTEQREFALIIGNLKKFTDKMLLLRIQDILDNLGGQKYFTSADIYLFIYLFILPLFRVDLYLTLQ